MYRKSYPKKNFKRSSYKHRFKPSSSKSTAVTLNCTLALTYQQLLFGMGAICLHLPKVFLSSVDANGKVAVNMSAVYFTDIMASLAVYDSVYLSRVDLQIFPSTGVPISLEFLRSD